MSVTLNGTSGYLEWSKGAGTMPIPSGPFTIIARARSAVVANQFLAASGQSGADRYAALWNTSGATLLSNYRNPGNGDSGQITGASLTAMKLAAAVFGATNNRNTWLAGTGFGTAGTTALIDDISNHDRITIGAYHVNGAAPSFFWNGEIAEVHIFSRALDATDFATLNADYKPELLSGWVDGWSLKDSSDLTSIGGTRTLTLIGGVTSTGSHPITRTVPATLSGLVTLDATVASGSSNSSTSSVSGALVLDDSQASGNFSSQIGTIVSQQFKSTTTRILLANTTFALATLLRVSDGSAAATISAPSTASDGRMTISSAGLSPGVDYLLVVWSADGSQAGIEKVTAA